MVVVVVVVVVAVVVVCVCTPANNHCTVLAVLVPAYSTGIATVNESVQ